MVCNDCVHLTECESLSTKNFDHAHKMWMIDFWGNAEQRCKNFAKKGKEGNKIE
jgi:hypothetical protein